VPKCRAGAIATSNSQRSETAWSGNGRHNLVEVVIGPYKAIVGPKLCARSLPAQQGEIAIAAEVLNRMIRAAKAFSIRGLTKARAGPLCRLTYFGAPAPLSSASAPGQGRSEGLQNPDTRGETFSARTRHLMSSTSAR
jgi:hypothetical protein